MIRISRDPGQVRLEISDKGGGFPDSPHNVRPGVGIQGMQERVRQLGGEFELRSDSQGTAVIAIIPIQETDQAVEVPKSDFAL